MKTTFNSKKITRINFTIIAYFVMVYSFYVFKVDFALIGVFVELLTIPFMIGQLVFFGIGIDHLIKKKEKSTMMLLSLVSLSICIVFTIASFF